MRAALLTLALLLAVVAAAPLVSSTCVPRNVDKTLPSRCGTAAAAAASSSSGHGAKLLETKGGPAKAMPLEEYGAPTKVAAKPKEEIPYAAATTPNNALEQSSDGSASLKKKARKEKSEDAYVVASAKKEKKEKSGELDASASLKKKEKKEKSGELDASASLKKKEKKEKSEELDASASLKKKEKKKKSDELDAYVALKKKVKKEKKEKSGDSLDADASLKKKEKKKKKSDVSEEDASLKKAKKAKKEKPTASGYFKEENEEKPADEDAAPVDVAASSGEYLSPKQAEEQEKSDEKSSEAAATPVDMATGQYGPTTSKAVMGGAPDELPPAAKGSTTTTREAYPSLNKQPTTAGSQAVMGGSPDEPLPPAAKGSTATSDAYGSPDELPPGAKAKPKVSVESLPAAGALVKRPPLQTALSPEIKRVCEEAPHPELCESSIGSLPGGAPPQNDELGVLRLAMNAVRLKAIEAREVAQQRQSAAAKGGALEDALGSCAKSYNDMRSTLDTATDALLKGDIDTARTNLDNVETDINTCDDGFTEHGMPSAMSDHDVELVQLASNLLAIAANMRHM